MEPDVCALLRANVEWRRNESWRFDCDGLEEGQDVVTIVCDGVHRLISGLLRLTWFRRLLVLCLYGDYGVFVVVVVFPADVFPFLLPLRDEVRKIIQELARVQLPVEDSDSVRNGGRRTALRDIQSR